MNKLIHQKRLVKDMFESPTPHSREADETTYFSAGSQKSAVNDTPEKNCFVVDDSIESTPGPLRDRTNQIQNGC